MSAVQLSLIDATDEELLDGDTYVIGDRWDVVDGKANSWIYVKHGCIGVSTAFRANDVPAAGGLRVMKPAEAEQLGRALVYWARAVRSAS